MVSLFKWSLQGLCCNRIAYCMWIHRDITKNCSKEEILYELGDAISNDVKLLTLPKLLKSLIVDQIKPVGRHLLSLLSFWISDKCPKSSSKLLTNDMLFECLVLNVYGLINPRETAKKLLRSRMLPNEVAFRLACINYLEREIFKLWIIVRDYFLTKIVLEGERANAFIAEHGRNENGISAVDLNDHFYSNPRWEKLFYDGFVNLSPFPFTEEPEEVLFWISFCISGEKAVPVDDIPHFLGDDVIWFSFLYLSSAFHGNVAFFDFFKTVVVDFGCLKLIQLIICSPKKDSIQPNFVLHFSQLNPGEISELLREFGEDMMLQFLQWPLSKTFLENPEEIWGLWPDEQKWIVLALMYSILGNEKILQNFFSFDNYCISDVDYLLSYRGIYSYNQVSELFVTLWKISSEDYKSIFLEDYFSYYEETWNEQQKFYETFEASGLKLKLIELFLANGEAFLEHRQGDNMKENLRSLVAKYMPEHFEDLDKACISFIEETEKESPENLKELTEENRSIYSNERSSNIVYPHHEKFLKYIQNFLLSSSTKS